MWKVEVQTVAATFSGLCFYLKLVKEMQRLPCPLLMSYQLDKNKPVAQYQDITPNLSMSNVECTRFEMLAIGGRMLSDLRTGLIPSPARPLRPFMTWAPKCTAADRITSILDVCLCSHMQNRRVRFTHYIYTSPSTSILLQFHLVYLQQDTRP